MTELADVSDLGSDVVKRAGSSPVIRSLQHSCRVQKLYKIINCPSLDCDDASLHHFVLVEMGSSSIYADMAE